MKTAEFWATYAAVLANCIADAPGKYRNTNADELANRTKAVVSTSGMGAVDIKGASWTAYAKRLGIKNTYKAWNAFYKALEA